MAVSNFQVSVSIGLASGKPLHPAAQSLFFRVWAKAFGGQKIRRDRKSSHPLGAVDVLLLDSGLHAELNPPTAR